MPKAKNRSCKRFNILHVPGTSIFFLSWEEFKLSFFSNYLENVSIPNIVTGKHTYSTVRSFPHNKDIGI